ncbi:MAG: hypothetical protein SP4CHLAM5_00150 [Chlamydiia bacterium]|nr:hypothetical protein [Chlamydiia bacterium]MCH9617894.1 hypothetical protein [Chlamydiia bacterium]MCH9624110.1 hypothetical protein [Chlamydiia bacterium]
MEAVTPNLPVRAESVSDERRWLESHKMAGPFKVTVSNIEHEHRKYFSFYLFPKVEVIAYEYLSMNHNVLVTTIESRVVNYYKLSNERVVTKIIEIVKRHLKPAAVDSAVCFPYHFCEQILQDLKCYRDTETNVLPKISLSSMTLRRLQERVISQRDVDGAILLSRHKCRFSTQITEPFNINWLCKAQQFLGEKSISELVDLGVYFPKIPKSSQHPNEHCTFVHGEIFQPGCAPIVEYVQTLKYFTRLDLSLSAPSYLELFTGITNFMEGTGRIESISLTYLDMGSSNRVLEENAMAVLAQAITDSKVLEEIHFENFTLTKETFEMLLSAISKTEAPVRFLTFNNCSTGKLVESFKTFLQATPKITYATMRGMKADALDKDSVNYISKQDENEIYQLSLANKANKAKK